MTDSLRRTLSLRDLVLIVVGTVIGSGIFLTPGAVLRSSGSPGMALLVWTIGGVLSLLGALTFAELGAAKPESGGLYAYLRDAFGPGIAFLFGWTMFLVIGSGSIATLGAAFPRYVTAFVPLAPWQMRLVSVLMIAVVAVINVRGTREGVRVQAFGTLVKAGVIALLATILIVAGRAASSAPEVPFWPETISLTTVSAAITGMIGVLWAYDGWQYVTYSAGETVEPQRTFARGIVIGTALLVGLYVLANVGYLRALGAEGMASSDRVASDAATLVIGPWAGQAMAVIILISIFSAANGLLLTLPRLFYAMARDRVFFDRLAAVHPRFGTPAAAIVGTSLWASVLVLSGSFEQLFTYVVFMSWLWFALAAATIFIFRRREPLLARPFRTPGYPVTPTLFIVAALVIVVNTVVARPVQSLVGIGLAVLGVPAYWVWRGRRVAPAESAANG